MKPLNSLSLLLLVLLSIDPARSQPNPGPDLRDISSDLATTLDCIAQLENRRDPKCFATASRLEDFMYGTRLSDEARFAKVGLQKELILGIWKTADSEGRAAGLETLSATAIASVLDRVLPYSRNDEGDWVLKTVNGKNLIVTGRDKRQYSTVAYGLRAVLAVQQERFLAQDDQRLLPLDTGATEKLKEFLDLHSLAALQIADRDARLSDQYEIEEVGLIRAWTLVGHDPRPTEPSIRAKPQNSSQAPDRLYALTRRVVAQKISSYEAYNEISMPVFLRNIQVYFARHRWAADPAESDRLKASLTETLIYFAGDLLVGAEKVARSNRHELVRVEDVSAFAQEFVPHRLNEFEDATFFPNLPKGRRVTLEAYDMDAFRDSGLHWQYLKAAIDEPEFKGTLEPDPFALELLVENIAQFGVLVLRFAGDIAAEEGVDRLAASHIPKALARVRERIEENNKLPSADHRSDKIASVESTSVLGATQTYFTDVTSSVGIDFRHRSSDWLSRFIRSYAIRNKEVAVLGIPPAFQGSGAASEDVDGDGLPDLLLLSGSGNRLLLNDGEGGFSDITESSGIDWRREDGLPGEPRQPIVADFDNDGRQDIFISYVDDSHRLYRGLGEGRFEDVTEGAGLGGEGLVGGPATAIDFDKDGLLDLYVTYFGLYTEGILPTLARRNVNGLPNKLFRNVGDMRFEDATEGSGVEGTGWTQAVAHTDFDVDGWQDLIEGNDFGVNAYYRNRGDGTFENVTDQLSTDKPSYTMGIGITDLNGDLRPDIYVSNIVTMDKDQKYVNPSDRTPMKFDAKTMAEMRVVEANDLFMSKTESGDKAAYAQSDAVARGRSSTGWAWGSDFFDFDNDGDDDLYVGNGMNEFAVYSSENPYYKDPEGNERNVLFPESTRETNVFFLNEGGKLLNSSEESGADLYGNSRAVVYLDYDGDGDLDMVLNNLHEDAVLYRNNSERFGGGWIKIRLVGDPEQKSTRDAIGATLVVTPDGGNTVWREIHGSVGYLSMHPKEQHVGLGQAKTADVEVRWPNGETLNFADLEAGRAYSINQKDGSLTALE